MARELNVLNFKQHSQTHTVLASVSVNPVAVLLILWAATEYPNSSVSAPRAGESLAMGLNVSMLFRATAAPHSISKHSSTATPLVIVMSVILMRTNRQ